MPLRNIRGPPYVYWNDERLTNYWRFPTGETKQAILAGMIIEVFGDGQSCFDPFSNWRIILEPTCDNVLHMVLCCKEPTCITAWCLAIAVDWCNMENMVEWLIVFGWKENSGTKPPDKHGKVEEEMELCFSHQDAWCTFDTDGKEVINNVWQIGLESAYKSNGRILEKKRYKQDGILYFQSKCAKEGQQVTQLPTNPQGPSLGQDCRPEKHDLHWAFEMSSDETVKTSFTPEVTPRKSRVEGGWDLASPYVVYPCLHTQWSHILGLVRGGDKDLSRGVNKPVGVELSRLLK